MGLSPSGEDRKRSWLEHFEARERPRRCVSCGHVRVWWNGSRHRSASVMAQGTVEYLPDLRCRRVRCAACPARWTVRPSGLAPRKHYQLDVVAQATATGLFHPRVALEAVAAAFRCARRTLGRWIRWLASLAAPAALLQRLAEIAPAPIVPRRPTPPSSSRLRHAFADRAAEVLTLFEALGTALGAEPPGLRAVLERWDCVPSYAAPALPDPLPVVAR